MVETTTSKKNFAEANDTKTKGSHINSTPKKSVPNFTVSDFEAVPTNEGEKVENSYKEKFLKSILDQSKNYPLPEPVINIIQKGESISFLTLKSFSLWQGKQKSKKTTALALAVVAFLLGCQGDKTGVQLVAAMEGMVLFFDTEQGQSYAARTMKLILKLAGVEVSPKLIYCDLREHAPNERMEIIKAGIECTPNVKLVIIDGLVDLMNDFMDPGEGHHAVTEILRCCSVYIIHIAGVLHQNKNDKNARAHIGTIASQKCEMEIATDVDTEDKSQSIVSCVNSRGMPFEPFAIRWDKGSLPGIVQEYSKTTAVEVKATKITKK